MNGPVLFITPEYPPMRGGMGDYTARLADALEENGCRTKILTGHMVRGDDERVLPQIRRWNWHIFRQVREAQRFTGARVVHVQYQTGAYGMHPAINLLPRSLGMRESSVPVVTTFHDLLPPYLFPKAGPLRNRVTGVLAKNSDAVVVTNERDLEHLSVNHRLGRRVTMIPIGSNLPDILTFDRDDTRRQLGLEPDGEIAIGFFGFLTEDKGVDILLRAMVDLQLPRPAKLVVIGGGLSATDVANRDYLQWIEGRLKECPIPVIETGFLPPERAAAALRAMDIVVLPFRHGASLRRGTLIAAVRAGAVVLTTDSESDEPLAPMVGGETIWLAAPSDPEALRAGIATLLGDESLCRQLASNALNRGAAFDWNSIAQRHIELYAALLERPRGHDGPR